VSFAASLVNAAWVGVKLVRPLSCLFNSIILMHPTIGEHKAYASTGLIKGSKDKLLAVIWNLKTNCLSS